MIEYIPIKYNRFIPIRIKTHDRHRYFDIYYNGNINEYYPIFNEGRFEKININIDLDKLNNKIYVKCLYNKLKNEIYYNKSIYEYTIIISEEDSEKIDII